MSKDGVLYDGEGRSLEGWSVHYTPAGIWNDARKYDVTTVVEVGVDPR